MFYSANKTSLLTFLLVQFFLTTYSQTVFKKGYYLDKTGQKVQCLIKDEDWLKNPKVIETRLEDNEEIKLIYPKDIQEFEIYENSKYLSRTVKIDVSSDDIGKLTSDKEPLWEEREVFLKVLLEGIKGSLYSFNGIGFRRLFFSNNSQNLEQLIYKKFIVTESKTAYNLAFKSQLINLVGEDQSLRILNMNYSEQAIMDIFKFFNNNDYKEFVRKEKRDRFELKVLPGLSYSDMTLNLGRSQVKYENQFDYRIGLELGFTLPFFNNSWSVIAEPNIYISPTRKPQGQVAIQDIEYKFLTVPLGIKGKSFLDKKRSLVYKGLFDFGTKIYPSFNRNEGNGFIFSGGTNLTVGVGYEVGKSCFEFRYVTNSNILRLYPDYNSLHQKFMIVYGYSLLKK
ncbi:hypothetical protein [Lacihabitans soyangensis]|uniref:Outer membrane protein beta-barrel domain-containing protein n=1 Tax=Lacihabitans soyangensis TaxID=869394 RepID=A0AAE3H0L7_9BACT|nr:hypothetical protein [Lacihabitans soyangensis]MCP9761851.1 hypothetical protein [Lacihabitans soyangensis]